MKAHTPLHAANLEHDNMHLSSDRYREEYMSAFVAKWDELIDWDRRALAEGSFFTDTLKTHGVRSVLDVATGTGFHSVRLAAAGFDVTSVDGSDQMLQQAATNGRRHGHELRTRQADWRRLTQSVKGPFDAIVCLGNSFTHLFDDTDRRKALSEYHALLRPGGLLILDQRNYDALLDHGVQPKHRFYYCGRDVCARPLSVTPEQALFRYEFGDGSTFHLRMFPLRKSYLTSLMRDAGFFAIETFGDFQSTYGDTDPDFFIHVARRPPVTLTCEA